MKSEVSDRVCCSGHTQSERIDGNGELARAKGEIASQTGPSILVVEGSHIVAFNLRERLSKLSYEEVHLEYSAEGALQWLNIHRPDLVLMDMSLLGQMNGVQAVKIMREHFNLPVVYITTDSNTTPVEQIRELPVDGYLKLPLENFQLHALIEQTVSRHEQDERRQEASLISLEKAHQESQAKLQEFINMMCHGLRQRLRDVTSMVDVMADSALAAVDTRELDVLSEVGSGLRRINSLVTDLQVYAHAGQMGRMHFASIAAEDALRWACDNLHDAIIESGAKITNDALPMVYADLAQVIDVFQKLLSNSIKYRKPGQRPRIHVSSDRRAGELWFSVSDNGVGFDPAESKRIFERFRHLKDSTLQTSTGVGLAICKRIIEGHGGQIWAESVPGVQTTVRFTLPDRGHAG